MENPVPQRIMAQLLHLEDKVVRKKSTRANLGPTTSNRFNILGGVAH